MTRDLVTNEFERRNSAGFTLIELMVVVVIVAILATIALPSYQDYVMRSRIAEAVSALAAKRTSVEQFFDNNRTYVNAPACASDTTTSKSFSFSCTTATATAYTIEALGTGQMAGFAFTIDQSNVKATSAVPSGWSQPNPNTCWITRRGGIC